MNKKDLSTSAQLLHASFPKPDAYRSISMPVYQTAAYEFDSAEQMEEAFTGRIAEHTYSRISNPTVENFETKIKEITGALSVTALNSGMAAISNALITLAQAGSNIVTSKHLFGNTYSFFASTLAAFGVETRFCDLTNPAEVEANIDANTCAVFMEIISNPQMEVIDLKALSAISKKAGVPLIADTTIIPFCAFRAKDWGVDLEVVSSTKYISGGATSLGGLILDYGTFDWSKSTKLQAMAKDFGQLAYTAKLRKEIHRNLGAYMTPQAAYMQTLGLETLSIRFERATATCMELAKQLESNAAITRVNYPGLTSSSYYELSKTQFGEFPGAMFTFDLASREAAFSFLNKLQLIRRATNLFDNKSLAIHPASTIFGTFSAEVRQEMNVSDCTIRISVGLESVSDLMTDILQALN